jgi:tRNA-binding protein
LEHDRSVAFKNAELVEDVPNSDKLVKLTVDFGDHKRSILVGMKTERENPKSDVEGKQALFVVNLEPKKMAGQLSEGMIFDIGYSDGILPVLALPEKQVPNGSRARSTSCVRRRHVIRERPQ